MTSEAPRRSPPFRSGYVAIVGWPNVGKSTLLNALLGTKLSIVTPKPQTTWGAVRGILNAPDSQAVFVDTPGWLRPSDAFQTHMRTAVVRSLEEDADAVAWVVEPRPLRNEESEFAARLVRLGKPLVVAVNKCDTLKAAAGREPIEASVRTAIDPDSPVLFVSAKTGEGVAAMRDRLTALLPEGPPYFGRDQLSDRWERFFAAEWIREKIFQLYREEVPHACAVAVEEFVEKGGRKDFIRAVLYAEAEQQKKILVGAGGKAIRALGEAARKEIEKNLGRPVYLELAVKVKKNWRKDKAFIQSLEDPWRG